MAFNLEEAARLYTRELLARAWALLGDWHEAEDAVQDAFAAACEKPPKPGGERAWLHRVTYNRCLDRLRRRRDVSLEALGDAAGGFTPGIRRGLRPGRNSRALPPEGRGPRDSALARLRRAGLRRDSPASGHRRGRGPQAL